MRRGFTFIRCVQDRDTQPLLFARHDETGRFWFNQDTHTHIVPIVLMQGIYFDCGPVAYVHVGKVFSSKNFVYYVRWMLASDLCNGRDRQNDPNDLC